MCLIIFQIRGIVIIECGHLRNHQKIEKINISHQVGPVATQVASGPSKWNWDRASRPKSKTGVNIDTANGLRSTSRQVFGVYLQIDRWSIINALQLIIVRLRRRVCSLC